MLFFISQAPTCSSLLFLQAVGFSLRSYWYLRQETVEYDGTFFLCDHSDVIRRLVCAMLEIQMRGWELWRSSTKRIPHLVDIAVDIPRRAAMSFNFNA
jgi:hypothetical protein